jgi:serine/threonine-protein kinase RsbW
VSAIVEDAGEAREKSATVTIIIPCRAEYVAIARLAILGVANRLAYSYDEVEDIRLAVGEACTHAVERALAAPVSATEPTIRITSRIDFAGLEIEVRDDVLPPPDESFAHTLDEDLGFDKQDLGALLLEILVDKFSVHTTPAGTTVLLLKNAPKPSSVANSS